MNTSIRNGQIILCPYCEGRGKQIVPDNSYPSYGIHMKSIICDVCKGGRVMQIKLERVEDD